MRPSDDTLDLAHLTDDQLVEIHLLLSDDQHLRTCPACERRYQALVGALEQVRDEAISQADAVFTAERLHDQRERILRRLERHEHPAEVLLFPSRSGQEQATRHLLSPVRRWVAAAAVAGLVAGLFLGFAVDRRVGSLAGPTSRAVSLGTTAQRSTTDVSISRDEEMLSEIEDALMGPRKVLELGVIDMMTTPAELQDASFDPQ
jgi:hypothetical protein